MTLNGQMKDLGYPARVCVWGGGGGAGGRGGGGGGGGGHLAESLNDCFL